MDPDYNPSYRSLINNKWVSTVCSIWIQSTSGSAYTFGIYSQALKTSQGYDQSTLDTISVFKDLGANVGVLAGLLYSAVTSNRGRPTTRFGGGPWVVLLGGAVVVFLGYFFMWLSVAGILPRPPVLLMGFYMLLASNATTFFNTANVVTAVHNFPKYSGTVVGIMKGFLGLSGAILILVYQTVLNKKPTAFILLLALLPSVNSLVFMWFVRIMPTTEADENKYLGVLSSVAVLLAAYLMVVIILRNVITFPSSARVSTFVILILLLLSFLHVAIRAQKQKSNRILRSLLEENQIFGMVQSRPDPEAYQQLPGNADEEMNAINGSMIAEQGDNLNLLQSLCNINFWLLFLTSACGMGSGLATVNNISQIGLSLGYSSVQTSTLVSLWSIWNFGGRFGSGYVSDYFLHAKSWPRPLFMVINLVAMTIGHIMIASGFPGALYAGSVLVGIGYGSQWSLMPTIVAEIFGSEHMGAIFNTITIANPVGTYILSVRVVGYLYDREETGTDNTCFGTRCFGLSFLIMAGTTLFGSLVALGLYFRTRNFYKEVILRRLNHLIIDRE
ncbi:OLC1v1012831C1 [Oldenlandia corymbosa var. corymbosa]|uniref:OLC1v1012831C1 n=1 Tax=Oldenlandia corymbosa var. corymbosa TaxID=529605 RepID=A0AAV1DXI5_OLDCO|nr:OLC1v1012831C1 [Oldenlandia corymbosa var. corymbosa]